jgi:hypothetical protein
MKKRPWVRIASSVLGFMISDIRSMSEIMNPSTLEAMRTQGFSEEIRQD